METKIKLFGVKWDVNTAGPSPDKNKRTEIFFFGCNRAVNGNPCKGCFNNALWDNSIATFSYTVEEIVNNIKLHASNKYVTIGGGEPTDQIVGLVELVSALKKEGFHVIIYTWRSLPELLAETSEKALYARHLLDSADMIIDGEFKIGERLYDDSKGDGLLSSVGSGNQIIWDIKSKEGYAMRDLDAIALDEDDRLIYFLKDINKESLKIEY